MLSTAVLQSWLQQGKPLLGVQPLQSGSISDVESRAGERGQRSIRGRGGGVGVLLGRRVSGRDSVRQELHVRALKSPRGQPAHALPDCEYAVRQLLVLDGGRAGRRGIQSTPVTGAH